MHISFGPFEASAVVIVVAAVLGWLNLKLVKLPRTIGLTIMGAVASLGAVLLNPFVQGRDLPSDVASLLDHVGLQATLLNGMLAFLLFAAALHVDLKTFRRVRGPVYALATLGVVVSMLVVALVLKGWNILIGETTPFIWLLVFGALISPTDPVAVASVVDGSSAPRELKATVTGESLLNDGAGIVLFAVMLATAAGGQAISPLNAGILFLREAGGGGLLGLAIGWIAVRMMRGIDDYGVEVLITLAVVMGGSVLARWLEVSGPVAMALAGLIIGNRAVRGPGSEDDSDHLVKFWDVTDQVLNAALFLVIGLEGVFLLRRPDLLMTGLVAIPTVLLARVLAIAAPLALWRETLPFRLALPILTWGGLRGGVSIALALSLPAGRHHDTILAATYVVVMFSVVVQGLTLDRLIRKVMPRRPASPPSPASA